MDEKEGGSCDFITRRVCSWKNVQYRDELETEMLNSNNKICVCGGGGGGGYNKKSLYIIVEQIKLILNHFCLMYWQR